MHNKGWSSVNCKWWYSTVHWCEKKILLSMIKNPRRLLVKFKMIQMIMVLFLTSQFALPPSTETWNFLSNLIVSGMNFWSMITDVEMFFNPSVFSIKWSQNLVLKLLCDSSLLENSSAEPRRAFRYQTFSIHQSFPHQGFFFSFHRIFSYSNFSIHY